MRSPSFRGGRGRPPGPWTSVALPSAAAALALAWAGCGPRSLQVPPPFIRSPDPILRTVIRETEVVTWPVPRSLRVCAGGDVMLGNNLDTLWAARASERLGWRVPPFPEPDSLLGPLRPLVRDADVVLFNIEGAIGDGPAERKCRPGSTACYAFRQPPNVAASLARFAYPAAMVANVANNHAMDAGPEGFSASIRYLNGAGVFVTGADSLATPIPTLGGDTLAVLGFSPFRAGPDPRDLDAVHRHVARAAARHRWVVVTMHTGAEGADAQHTPNASEMFLGENRGNSVAIARTAVEAGASLVIGHGPHVLRAHEWRGHALIVYSLGNLLTYGPFNLREPSNRGAIACARLDGEGRVEAAEMRSTWLRPPGVVAPDPTGRGATLVDSLSRLDFPDTAGRVVGGLLLRPDSVRGDGER